MAHSDRLLVRLISFVYTLNTESGNVAAVHFAGAGLQRRISNRIIDWFIYLHRCIHHHRQLILIVFLFRLVRLAMQS